MRKPSQRYPSNPEFEFEIAPEPLEEGLTSYGGVPLLVRAFRSLRLPESIRRRLRIRRRERGVDEASMVESFVVLNAVGGECQDDFQHLRADAGLADWLRDEQRKDGPQGSIGFAVSARMSEALTQAVRAVPESDWKPYGKEDVEVIRACAEVAFCPAERSERKDSQPLRYGAVRIRKRQGELFAGGSAVKHFAVLSNLWKWAPARLLAWHREKAGTIEAVHNILKNDLAAGVLPAKRFGANAAWLRLAVLTLNLLTALKRLALPPELLSARPKRLRFLFFNAAGRIVGHARKTLLRLAMMAKCKTICRGSFRLLPVGT